MTCNVRFGGGGEDTNVILATVGGTLRCRLLRSKRISSAAAATHAITFSRICARSLLLCGGGGRRGVRPSRIID